MCAYYYAKDILKGRWIGAEKIILSKPRSAYLYTKYVLKARNPHAEKIIITDPQDAYLYAKYVIKGRWKQFENYQNKPDYTYWSSFYYYQYAKGVIKARWPEKEEIIFKSMQTKYLYICDVIKQRMESCEEELINKNYYEIPRYFKMLKHEEKIEFKNKIIMFSADNVLLAQWIKGYGKNIMKEILSVDAYDPSGL